MNELIVKFKGLNGTIELYEDKLVIIRKGLFAALTTPMGDSAIPIDKIQSVEYKAPGIMNGYIQFSVPGVRPESTNVIVNTGWGREEAEQIKDYVEKRILERTSNSDDATSTADEIAKFKSLLDMGAITEEEYEAKKKQLLEL